MRTLLFICLILLSTQLFAQDKYNYVYYDDFTDVSGTNYVVGRMGNGGKLRTLSRYIAFINVQDGSVNQVDFINDSYIGKMEQIRIDSLGFNKILLPVKTIDLDHKNSIDWNDPMQIMILSVDGNERRIITPDDFFVSTWAVNRNTAKLVITGHFDTNANGKYDKKDKHQILIYDLVAMKMVKSI